MRSSLQDIFRDHFAHYAQGRALHPREWRAGSAIRDCHSAALGGHVLSCEHGHDSRVQYNACRHRSCPTCADKPRQQWLQRELPRLLPCDHHHAVFTLPHEFIALWECNRAWINALLFDSARASLLELCADERHLGARPGLLMALHSWGRTLSRHPHVHCLVSAGGLDAGGRWRAPRRGAWLVPVKALAALYRGKLLHALKRALVEQRLQLPRGQDAAYWLKRIAAQYRTHWNVQLGAPYAHGRGVALYLARYVKGGPLAGKRALDVEHGRVSLDYVDHRDRRAKTLVLTAHDFIERVLWHAPPRGQHLVRRGGLYATSARGHHRRCVQHLTPQAMPEPQPTSAWRVPAGAPATVPVATCRVCAAPLLRTASLLPAHRGGEYSMAGHGLAAQRLGPTPAFERQPTAVGFQALRRRSLRR